VRLGAAEVEVLVLTAAVADRTALAGALGTVAERFPPMRGVIHAAGVLDDGALVRQDWSRFAAVMAPKVDGAIHLHELTAHLPLDHFVLFSSAAALFGSRGQANHAAANGFLDALAAERRAHGRPGLSINWGAWAGVGSVVTHGLEDRASAHGVATMTPAQALAALGALMTQGRPQVGVVPMDWPVFLRQFAAAVPPWLSEIADRQRGPVLAREAAAVPVVRDELAAAPPAQRPQRLADFVAGQVASVLGAAAGTVDEQLPLNELGLDSLMAVELRNRIGAGLAVEEALPATIVFDYPTVTALAGYLDRALFGGGEGIASEEAAVDGGGTLVVEDLLSSIEQMSDEDVARMFGE
jgi:KR domain/Phosphopantetheine attachment site